MTTRRRCGVASAAILVAAAGVFSVRAAAQRGAATPETVMVTVHARPGAEAELARVLERHWSAAHALNLVLDTPHMTLRGTDDGGKVYFVDIFTWRDAAIPDAAPPAIQAIWSDMNRLSEARNGRPGIDFTAVSVLHP